MHRPARILLATLAWLYVGGVVVQVFLAGLGLFDAGSLDWHRAFGYLLTWVPLLLLIVGLGARPDRRTGWLLIALAVLGGAVQPSLPYFRTEGYPVIAALHPPTALLVFLLGVIVARRSVDLIRSSPEA